ncbi:MAG: cell division protein FtsL [Clostridia bacterium]|nr:cell division protein FtsL [Clostridia bacterium]
MNELYRGTSAYKLEEYESHAQKSREKHIERKNTIKIEKRALCRLLVVSIFALFVAASALVYVNVMTLRASTEVDALEKQLAIATEKNKQKEIEITQKLDMKVIEKKAVEKLGMQKPDNNQIMYIDVKKDTYSEAVKQKSNISSFFGGIKNALGSIVEYFS